MRVNEISTVITPKTVANTKKQQKTSYASFNSSIKQDSFSFTGVQADNVINFRQTPKTMHVVTFTGLNDPTPVAIQFKVRGVVKNQDDYVKVLENPSMPSTKPINKLAKSDWKDGKILKFAVDPRRGSTMIVDPNFGPLGVIPEDLEVKLQSIPEFASATKRDQNFRLELSNMVAGTTKGAKTTGLRVNLLYLGKDKQVEENVKKVFDDILNDKESNDLVFLYQQKASPEKVLEKIFENDKINNNVKASEEAKIAIKNIVDVIDDPKNKNILLIGHCKPDGDTLGCILGLKNAIDYKYSDKNVDCSVDDKIPGLFRSKLPGVDDVVKRPFGKNRLVKLNQTLATLEADGSESAKDKIEILQDEKAYLTNPANLLSRNKKYDVVVLMDVPTPKRFTDEFKDQIEGANKVIYIDHHPHRLNEWQEVKGETGVDMQKIHDNHLAWVADAVPAATEQVGILAKKLIPNLGEENYKDLTQDKKDKLDAFVASTVVGMSTDTGAFTRTANLLPQHMEMPVQQRPNFLPEGMSKWLMGLSDKVNKKWLREEITYDIPDEKVPDLDKTSRDKMVGYAEEGKKIVEDLSLGVMEVNYDKMFDVWKSARKSDKFLKKADKDMTEFLDIQNAFKYSELMGLLKSDPNKRPENPDDYKGSYDNDRIAILICQDKKAGELDEKYNIATENGLRLSLRSNGCSDHAELLSALFGGGGHGGASGGRVDLPGVEIDSKLGVMINGKKETDTKAIYKTIRKNVDIRNDNSLSDAEKLVATAKVDVVMDESGKTCTELIQDVTAEIRAHGGVAAVTTNNTKSSNNGYGKDHHDVTTKHSNDKADNNKYNKGTDKSYDKGHGKSSHDVTTKNNNDMSYHNRKDHHDVDTKHKKKNKHDRTSFKGNFFMDQKVS